jgi:hypothetical protein
MHNRFLSLILALLIVVPLPLWAVMTVWAAPSENLGAISECIVDKSTEKIVIRGSLKHGVLVNNREAKLAVYRFDPWVNVESAVKKSTPLATMDMTIRFEFELPCSTISQRLSLYAVAVIQPNGGVTLVSAPRYPDYATADTGSAGFKSVITENVSSAVAAHPGSAVIDVFLDKLDKGNKSGYIFNADGKLFYFDRDVINELDKKVLAYTAAGAEVYFRFLVSSDANDLPFATKGNIWATNKCVVINDAEALNAIYAYTYFLVSRYDGAEHGNIDGIILGKGADMPILYNFATLVSENYETVYARSLSVIGTAAAEAAGNNKISLIVPVGDTLTENGEVYALDFLESVAAYLSDHTKLKFTVMCESRHNPYKLKDSFFSEELDPDDTGEEDFYPEPEITGNDPAVDSVPEITVETEPVAETTAASEITFGLDAVTTEAPDVSAPEDTDASAPDEPQINTSADGYFCTDNIDVFIKAFKSFKKRYSSVNDGFAWCWYPGSDTSEGALSVCYAYNYVKLAATGADFYAVCFDDAVGGKLLSIAHLFKYIDTADSDTEYAKKVFKVSDWSEIIDGYSENKGIFHDLREGTLAFDQTNFVGSVPYFDYSSGRGGSGWYNGLYCNSLGVHTENGEGFLQAVMDLDSAGVGQSEIGYIFEIPEPLMLGDALSFDVKCGEDDGSLYEIAIHICSGDITVVSKNVVAGGARSTLSVDVSECDNTNGVESIKITLKRVTGNGDCKFNLYNVLVNSYSLSDDQLLEDLENIRDYLRAESNRNEIHNANILFGGMAALSVLGTAALIAAYLNDRKNKTDETVNIKNNGV